MEKEIWKPIKGYEGRYRISSKGRVFSIKNNKIMSLCDSSGYYMVKLSNGCVKTAKMKKVHRLVAEAFIPNPKSLPCINHINGNKLDNNFKNLEWCTVSQNTKHAYDNNLNNFTNICNNLLKRASDSLRLSYGYVLIVLVSKEDLRLQYFKTTKEAAKFLKTSASYLRHIINIGKDSIHGYKVYGFKNKDLQKFANWEPLPDILRGIPWEICLEDKQSCNDYPSEGE